MSATSRSFKAVNIDTKDMDTTKHVEVTAAGITWTPEEERALVRKIDTYLLPTIWLMYLLSYMDRTKWAFHDTSTSQIANTIVSIGNAKIAGMATDLGLTSNQYSISLIVFFGVCLETDTWPILTPGVTYVFFEAPSNMLLARIKPSLYLPAIMIIWGALTCVMAAIHDFKHLVVLRIFVGVFEAGFAPGILLLLSSWYKREEQSKRFAVYISAAILSGAFGGLLAGAITGGLDGAYGIVSTLFEPCLTGLTFCSVDGVGSSSLKEPLRLDGLSSRASYSSTFPPTPADSPTVNELLQSRDYRKAA
jgi:MFS family permease